MGHFRPLRYPPLPLTSVGTTCARTIPCRTPRGTGPRGCPYSSKLWSSACSWSLSSTDLLSPASISASCARAAAASSLPRRSSFLTYIRWRQSCRRYSPIRFAQLWSSMRTSATSAATEGSRFTTTIVKVRRPGEIGRCRAIGSGSELQRSAQPYRRANIRRGGVAGRRLLFRRQAQSRKPGCDIRKRR